MKMLLPTLAAVLALSLLSRAQGDEQEAAGDLPASFESGWEEVLSLSARFGYGFRVGGSQYIGSHFGETRLCSSFDGVLLETDDHYLNYGQGLKVELAGDYTLMPHVGAELALHFTGKAPRTRIEYDSIATSWKETFKQACFGAKVMIVPRFRVIELIDMHAAFGIGLFFATLSFTNSDPLLGQHTGYIKTRPGLAFAGRIGAEYPLSDRVAITANLCAETVSFTVKQRRGTTDPTVYTSDYNRSSLSSSIERPEKIPGSNVSILIGTRIAIY